MEPTQLFSGYLLIAGIADGIAYLCMAFYITFLQPRMYVPSSTMLLLKSSNRILYQYVWYRCIIIILVES